MLRQKRDGFSMIELMVAAVVLVVLMSVAVAGYQGYRDRAAMLVDETNQKVLAAAVKLYAYDNNALPGSLSQLQPAHLDRAFAMVTEGKRPYTVFAFLREWVGVGIAEAEVLPPRYYNSDSKILACPLDKTPPSYEIAAEFRGASLQTLLAAQGNLPLIVENSALHMGGTTAVITTVGGSHQREKKPKGTPAKKLLRNLSEDKQGKSGRIVK